MNITDIIYKKCHFQKLTSDEISYAIDSFTSGIIPDYQMSSLLMAICLNGMDGEEIFALTKVMLESGIQLDLSKIPGKKIDKHSTGGVGDGISLVLAPLVASTGVVVPMMAGRGLEHTGGTIDKLESIPGFKVELSKEAFLSNLSKIGLAISGQTDEIAPADNKLYALRDVSCTVDSIPLISSSIMSKKLAEGCDGLVFDIKTGSGAFSKTLKEAKALALQMMDIAGRFGRKSSALITDMSQPLGNAVGNALEVKQAIEVLRGEGPKDFKELTIKLSARMLLLSGEKSLEKARNVLNMNLENGKALAKFREMVALQGGDPSVCEDPEKILPKASERLEIRALEKGFIDYVDTRSVGIAANLLGSGRFTKEDKIDPASGIKIRKKRGDFVEKNEAVAEFYFNGERRLKEAEEKFRNSFVIKNKKPKNTPLIAAEIRKV